MSNYKTLVFVAIWVICGTLGLAYLWGNHPDFFPIPPEAFANWFLKVDGSELALAEVHFVLIASFILVSSTTFLACLLLKRGK